MSLTVMEGCGIRILIAVGSHTIAQLDIRYKNLELGKDLIRHYISLILWTVYACPPKLIMVYMFLHETDKLTANTISQLTGQYIHLTWAMYAFLPKLTTPYDTRHATDDLQGQC